MMGKLMIHSLTQTWLDDPAVSGGGTRVMSKVGLKETAVLCVLRSGDELLLLSRGREPNKGLYVPVGGHVDPFEPPRDAAIREVEEETGLLLADVRFCGVLVETSPSKYNWVTFVYSAEVERFPPPDCSEGVLEWVATSRLGNIATPPTDAFIYRFVSEGRPFVMDARFDDSLELVLLKDEISREVLYAR